LEENKKYLLAITSLEGNLDLLEEIIGFAVENNIKISLNPGNREIASTRRLQTLISHIDFLLLNGQESEALFGGDIKQICPLIAVTNGRQGADIYTESDHLFSPIINTRPVDETGAGDAFGSAFVSALIQQKSLETALNWGIKNSASVVSYLGAKKGILTLNQIK
jgi:sugar/nucleoside kinase (ribokinase family)